MRRGGGAGERTLPLANDTQATAQEAAAAAARWVGVAGFPKLKLAKRRPRGGGGGGGGGGREKTARAIWRNVWG